MKVLEIHEFCLKNTAISRKLIPLDPLFFSDPTAAQASIYNHLDNKNLFFSSLESLKIVTIVNQISNIFGKKCSKVIATFWLKINLRSEYEN
ncbi:hypothetical protein BpHYR1_030817 [Brachionus plicatilis]|uniref:Uncharacterized protein n=1 Tax=Brachionus plicatilis TaxID=10195 RepID=A0A3M7PAP3_BRAPC|nr:hypothetical protein BpHYR1_030817 [Brachionus plicatilis]